MNPISLMSFDDTYPVGIIVPFFNDFDPNTKWNGTWIKLPSDTFLAQAGITILNNEGGDNNAIVVKHNHGTSVTTDKAGKHTHDAGTYKIEGTAESFLTGNEATSGPFSLSTQDSNKAWNTGAARRSKLSFSAYEGHGWSGSSGEAGEHSHTLTLSEKGEDGTNKNMPKYLAVNYWKRTA